MKSKFLKYPTEPIEVWPEKKISELVEEMLKTGYQGRKLAECVEVWTKMLKRKNIVIWMGLAGAMVPAGMRKIISYFIQRRMIDVLVSTGANLYHDAFEACMGKHYVGSHLADDDRLRKEKVDRIYDVFADEDKFYKFDNVIHKRFVPLFLKDNYPYSSREILYLFGKFLYKNGGEKDSILVSAYKNKVPIFCPALGDSSLGFSLMFANRSFAKGKRVKVVKIGGKLVKLRTRNIIVDMMKDVDESSRITEKAKQTGVVYIGGGVPKNYIQQTTVISGYQTRHDKSHSFAIQVSTDMPQWGGLSGCTFEEAKSWGKIGKDAKMAACHVDATIALPIISHAMSERFKTLRREVPQFHWNSKSLKIWYEKKRL